MARQTWVYPNDGSDPVLKENYRAPATHSGVAILPDLPDFISPIDGRAYSGRAGLREHCLRHDVVPNAELKGLPVLTTTSDTRSESQKRSDAASRKQLVINQVNRHYK